MSANIKSNEDKKNVQWKIRLVNILANAGQWFVIPYAGSALAQVPSVEIAVFTMIVGVIASASREGSDIVREHRERR